VKLTHAFAGDDAKAFSVRVDKVAELKAAVKEALAFDGLSLIELTIDKDDCARQLLQWCVPCADVSHIHTHVGLPGARALHCHAPLHVHRQRAAARGHDIHRVVVCVIRGSLVATANSRKYVEL
jgi:hypothetical protein